MSAALPAATILSSSGFSADIEEENDLEYVYERRYYQKEGDKLVVAALPSTNISSVRTSAPITTATPTLGHTSDTQTLNYIHGLVVKALENSTSRLIVEAALSALGDLDRHSSLWEKLDELLIHTGHGYGARSTETYLRQLRSSNQIATETHHIKLEVHSSPQTRTYWVKAPSNIPEAGQRPPLVLDTQGLPIPEYCLYIQPHDDTIQKAWLSIPGRGWKEVKQGDRHPVYEDRVLRLSRNDGRVKPSWPKETSMGAMKRRDKAKASAASGP